MVFMRAQVSRANATVSMTPSFNRLAIVKLWINTKLHMKNACEPFEGKKITLLGLGLLGRGAGDAEFLAKCGAHVVVTDRKTEAELSEPIERLRKYPNIEFH